MTGPPVPSSDAARVRMSRQRVKDTAPETALRRVLHGRGLRYRLQQQPLVGVRRKADLVFGPAKVAVMVDGCFWHGCPQHGTTPRANRDWWVSKISRNVERDRETDELLMAAGWLSLRVWEHEDPVAAADRVERAVRERRAPERRPASVAPRT